MKSKVFSVGTLILTVNAMIFGAGVYGTFEAWDAVFGGSCDGGLCLLWIWIIAVPGTVAMIASIVATGAILNATTTGASEMSDPGTLAAD